MRRVLITGAGGRIGRTLRDGLVGDYALVLVDRRPQYPAGPGEEVLRFDVADLDATQKAMAGVDAVVHLAARADEAPFEELLPDNIAATYAVFEAARRARVPRVVFASTNRVTGWDPPETAVGPESPVRPDGYYAVSKIFGEALTRLYADKYGLEVACLRIGSFAERPTEIRHLGTWLSPADCVRLFRASLDVPELEFLVAYGASANTRRWWTDEGWSALGYRPEDDAEAFAADVETPVAAT